MKRYSLTVTASGLGLALVLLPTANVQAAELLRELLVKRHGTIFFADGGIVSTVFMSDGDAW